MTLFNLFYTAGPNGLWIFLLVSVVMGASTAYVAGKAIAETWRPYWHGLLYALVIGLAVRFIHFALFEELLVSARNYMADCIILVLAATAGYKVTRSRQMRQQYGFLVSAAPTAEKAAE